MKAGPVQPYSGGNGVRYSGFVAGESPSVLAGLLSYGGTSQGAVEAGEYAIAASGLTALNYDLAYVDGRLLIGAPAAVTGGPVAGEIERTVRQAMTARIPWTRALATVPSPRLPGGQYLTVATDYIRVRD